MEHYDICIIGGGPAGLTAAIYAARGGHKTCVFEKAMLGGQMATTGKIENYPGFREISGTELSEKMADGAAFSGAEIIHEEVTGCDLSSSPKKIFTEAGQYSAGAVIIATGASPRKLNIPGEEALSGKGVSYCAECDGAFFKGKTVAVVGGGDSAVTNALYLDKICKKVFLIHRRETLRASEALIKALEHSGAEFLPLRSVVSISGEDRVTGIITESAGSGGTDLIVCDGVFIAAGRVPESKIFADTLPTENGYIVSGDDTALPIPGVFAAGDVKAKKMRQIITAASDGAVAAGNAVNYLKTSAKNAEKC